MGAYQAAGTLGLSIPGDVSVDGFDDQEMVTDSVWPGLTTVALPHYEMGRWAVRTLLDQVNAEPPYPVAHALIPCPVIRRGSVATPPSLFRPATSPQHEVLYRPGGEPSLSNNEHLVS
jgi:LacI family transcriptional regulator